jgi:hypothetical protein
MHPYRFLLLVFCSSSAFALYNGSPALPEMPEQGFFSDRDGAVSFKAGYEGDFTFGRHLQVSSIADPQIYSQFNAASLTLGFINRIEVYALLGGSLTQFSCTSSEESIELNTKENFAGEVGIRANTPIWGDLKFGVDAKYFYAWPTLSDAPGSVFQKEWQVGASFSQTFAYFIPYVGVKFGKFYMEYVDLDVRVQNIFLQNACPVGLFIGMGIAATKGIYLDLEARFVDEYAFTGALGMSF